MKPDRVLRTYKAVVTDGLTLETNICTNGDPGRKGLYYEHKIRLQGIYSAAVIEVGHAQISPDTLRKIANTLEQLIWEAAEENSEV
jgi:hypothetical protein